jgi:tetratricopeptide (TPR) repeat protein
MKALPCSIAAALLLWTVPGTLAETKAWQDTITLPTWREGPPETAPRLDSLDPDRSVYHQANYPYATRSNFTKTQEPQEWRRLNLENEYLSCSFLPDLGGHLYTCIDKLNARPIFRANASIKKADIGVRGAWVALGIEWNFPVGHSRDTVSPVNFGFRQEKDRAEVWVGNVDRVTGMEWLAEFVLRNGSAVLEENVTLRNATEVRHPYYWWANADIALDAGTRFVYPVRVMATHGLTDLEPWPRGRDGVDLSDPANAKEELGIFGYGSREPFIAIYNATSRTAAVHVADPAVVAGKKVWSWAVKEQQEFSSRLSDDNTSSVEMQAGVFENQETYRYLQPHRQIQFTELWLAGRGLSGVTRANGNAVLSFERRNTGGKSALAVELNVTHAIAGAHIRVLNGTAVVLDDKADLTPSTNYSHSIPDPVKGAHRFELRDGAGALLLAHTEGIYETVDSSNVKLGPQPPNTPGLRREKPGDYLDAGEYDEENSEFRLAEDVYRDGLAKFPKDVSLIKAMGRLLAERQRYPEAAETLSEAVAVLPLDAELRYYQGLALSRSGKEDESRKSWAIAAAAPDAEFGAAALVEMAALESRAGHSDAALVLVTKAIERSKDSLTARKLQVALLRRAGKPDEARRRWEEARAIDPVDSFLRLEGIHLGANDDGLWMHLAADPERVLDIADAYIDFGMYQDAMAVLDHTYSPVPGNQTEPGSVLPQDYPLVAYYRGYCRQRLGQSAAADFKLASSQRLEYVFPNRADSVAVLQAAIQQDARDASAHFLLGLLYLNGNPTGKAVTELEAARAIRKDIPELYFVLSRALLSGKDGKSAAISILREGMEAAPSNQELKDLMAAVVAAPKPPPAAASAPAPASAPASTASVTAYPGGKKPGSPAELASFLLARAALGEAPISYASFTAENFPQEKQPDSVRKVYIELQLQFLRGLLSGRRCGEALAGVDTIGSENKSLPFTLYGFDEWIKGARFQYYLGAVEAGCGDEKSARRRWSKVAKMTPALTSADAVFPLVAAQNLASKGKVAGLQPLLEKITQALSNADPDSKGVLLYSKGILLLAQGDEATALLAFQDGAAAPDHEMSRYLNDLALQEATRAKASKQ